MSNFLPQACGNLRPEAGISIDENGVHWHGIDSIPTQEEIDAEVARLEAEYALNAYKAKRAALYPSFADQFDLLYHGGMDAWKAAIDAVKQEYPKP